MSDKIAQRWLHTQKLKVDILDSGRLYINTVIHTLIYLLNIIECWGDEH